MCAVCDICRVLHCNRPWGFSPRVCEHTTDLLVCRLCSRAPSVGMCAQGPLCVGGLPGSGQQRHTLRPGLLLLHACLRGKKKDKAELVPAAAGPRRGGLGRAVTAAAPYPGHRKVKVPCFPGRNGAGRRIWRWWGREGRPRTVLDGNLGHRCRGL